MKLLIISGVLSLGLGMSGASAALSGYEAPHRMLKGPVLLWGEAPGDYHCQRRARIVAGDNSLAG